MLRHTYGALLCLGEDVVNHCNVVGLRILDLLWTVELCLISLLVLCMGGGGGEGGKAIMKHYFVGCLEKYSGLCLNNVSF